MSLGGYVESAAYHVQLAKSCEANAKRRALYALDGSSLAQGTVGNRDAQACGGYAAEAKWRWVHAVRCLFEALGCGTVDTQDAVDDECAAGSDGGVSEAD